LNLSFSVFSGWVWPEMKKSSEMVWLEMVGHGWVNRRRRGEGEEEEKKQKLGEEACVRSEGEEEEEEKNQGKKRA
jgi:hypothetical protein